MQKDQSNKGQEKSEFVTTVKQVGEITGHKLKEVGHDVNANLKEKVGFGVGNYSSEVDRSQSEKHKEQYEEKKQDFKEEREEKKKRKEEEKEEKKKKNEIEREEKRKQDFEETGKVGHKVQEVGHNVNATLKEKIGVGVGNYTSQVDRERAQEHKEKYEEIKEKEEKERELKKEEMKEKIEEKKEEVKEFVEEKKEEVKEKIEDNKKSDKEETSIYGHKAQELGHSVNAKMKENLGFGFGDYPSDVDKEKVEEHREKYTEKVKEESSNTEVKDSIPIVHKIKEVAHSFNASMKELIGIGVGNYSSEVDRELIGIHHQKYEEKILEIKKEKELREKEKEREREQKEKEKMQEVLKEPSNDEQLLSK